MNGTTRTLKISIRINEISVNILLEWHTICICVQKTDQYWTTQFSTCTFTFYSNVYLIKDHKESAKQSTTLSWFTPISRRLDVFSSSSSSPSFSAVFRWRFLCDGRQGIQRLIAVAMYNVHFTFVLRYVLLSESDTCRASFKYHWLEICLTSRLWAKMVE